MPWPDGGRWSPQLAIAALERQEEAVATRVGELGRVQHPATVAYLYECLEHYAVSTSAKLPDASRAASHARLASEAASAFAGPEWRDCARHIGRSARVWEARERRARRLTRIRTSVAFAVSFVRMRHRRPPQLTMDKSAPCPSELNT